MKRRRGLKIVALCLFSPLSGCVHSMNDGPGMIVNFSALIEGRSISMKAVRLPDGTQGFNPGSFGGKRGDWRHGKAAGMAGDGRQLPEWVEFEWSEPPYPEDPKQTLEEYRALPRKSQRVPVRNRIPTDVVQEVIRSRKETPQGKLPHKKLWVYFVWTEQGVKLRWRLEDSRPGSPSREGGDDLDSV